MLRERLDVQLEPDSLPNLRSRRRSPVPWRMTSPSAARAAVGSSGAAPYVTFTTDGNLTGVTANSNAPARAKA